MTNEPRRCPRCQSVLPADAPEGACPRCLLAAGFPSDDGAPPADAPERAEVERLFPDMEILEVLGRGGMGVVFKARQTALDRHVALKVLPRDVAASGGDVGRFADRFTREARALARLTHPHIVGVHEFGDRDGLYYFVMEYVDGVNLRQVLDAGGLQPAEALAIVPQICDALQYAHDQGVVHRDIKPENILIARGDGVGARGAPGHVKIADFGLAKLVVRAAGDRTLTRDGLVMGTPHYMAPEQVESPGDVDHRADIYSLGVVLYEMLTGELPLGRFAKPSDTVRVDVRLDEIVLRTLEKRPERRYQQVSDVKTSIGAVRETAPPPVAAAASPAPRRTSRLAVWGLAITPITAALAAVVLFASWLLLAADGTDRTSDTGIGLAMILVATCGTGVVVGVGLSIAALVSIHRSGGEKQGTALAVIGLLLPLLCCIPLGGALLTRSYMTLEPVSDEPFVYPVPEPEPAAPEPRPDGR